MSGFSVANNEHLIRSQLWSKQIKELLLDDLFAMKWVRTITDFPDGTLINIPSIGEATTADFTEGAAIKYNKLDTGNFQFSFDQYKYSAHSITAKFKRDSFYAAEVIAAIPQREHRALMEAVEARILSRGNAGQTVANLNTINGVKHRWVASGSSPTNSITLTDFANAWGALQRANVPMRNLVAIVDPSVAYTLKTQANIVNLLTPIPQWGSVTKDDIVTGMKFQFNIYGFDVYVSNYLPLAGALADGSETINARSVTNGVCNMFFSAAPGDTLPIIGGWKQMPTVYSEFNKDLQQDEHLVIAEYGYKLYRPENMVIIISDKTVLS
jgi:hypothetical protein